MHSFKRIALIMVMACSFVNTTRAFQLDLPMLPSTNHDGFVVIAHRGGSAYSPENTMSAFRKAVSMKAEMIELDVLLSKDGVPVVIHDATVDRTTNTKGTVSDFTLAELRKMDAGSWFDEKFKGEKIPTLEEVLQFAKDKIAVNIEIKTEAVTDSVKNGIVEKCLKIVGKAGVKNQVIFSSFDYRALNHLEELAPEMPKAMLYEKSQSGEKLPSELVQEYHVNVFNCSHKQLSDEWIADLKKNNIPFFIYTVNDRDLMGSLIKKGATGIFSDKPDVLKEVVENL